MEHTSCAPASVKKPEFFSGFFNQTVLVGITGYHGDAGPPG